MPKLGSENSDLLIPVSRQQEGVWFHSLKEGTAYWNYIEVKAFAGVLDADLLARALEVIVGRHSSLRTNFRIHNDKLYQVINESIALQDFFFHKHFDVSNQQEIERAVEAALRKEENHAFDFENEPLLRFALFDFQGVQFYMVLTISHIVTDAESMFVFWQELIAVYNSFVQDEDIALKEVSQYIDYSNEHAQFFLTEAFKGQLAYWQNKVFPHSIHSNLPFKSAAAVTSLRTRELVISSKLIEDIRSFTLRNRVLYSSVYEAAYMLLISDYSQTDSVVINNVLSGRGFGKKRYKGTIGLFSNRVLVSCTMKGEMTLKEFVDEVSQELISNFANSDIPYEDVIRWFHKTKKIGLQDIVSAVFNMMPGKAANETFEGLKALDTAPFSAGQAGDIQYDIGLSIFNENHHTKLRLDLKCDDLFEAAIPILIKDYLHILNECVYNPVLTIRDLKLRAGLERGDQMNVTKHSYPHGITIVNLIIRQALLTPFQIAVQIDDRSLTYQELHEKSNQLANHLVNLRVAQESLVAICIERSVEMLVGILGILKAGGAYVPIDPAYPMARIEYILSDTGCKVILSSTESRVVLPVLDRLEVVSLDEHWSDIDRNSKNVPEVSIEPTHLIYVIYTSGSSGRPKGVMNQHDGVLNRIIWAQNYFQLTGEDKVLQKTTFSFDVSVWELLWPLTVGARIVFARPGLHADPYYLLETIQNVSITMMHFVPSVMEQFLLAHQEIDCPSLQKVLCSGEELKPYQVSLFKSKIGQALLYNLYGPTECAIDVTVWQILDDFEKNSAVPIGSPVHNVSIYIMGDGLLPLPVGVPGEVCVSGIQVARGYLNQPELTSEKFCIHPLAEPSLLYKTGDLGRWLPEGNILYLGRIDNQIKINGNRIELVEIETCIQESGLVKQAVVVARQKNNHSKELVGFIVPGQNVDVRNIINFLLQILPSYMVPQIWIPLEEMPLNQNGKIDRNKLLEYKSPEQSEGSRRSPATKTEAAICSIWEDLLEIDGIGVDDHFFSIGGDSLLAMRMTSLIRNSLSVPVTIKDIFQKPTIADLSLYLDIQFQNKVPSIPVQHVILDQFPLSYSQERLWFIDKLEGSINYHIPSIYKVKGGLDVDALAFACKVVINRHECLRTVISSGDEGNYQHILEAQGWELRQIHAEELSEDEDAIQALVQELVNQPFDLAEDYMLRVHVIIFSPSDCILIINIHHIAFDAWSWNILASELSYLYKSYPNGRAELPAITIQYKDYAFWQRQYLSSELLAHKLTYWKKVLANAVRCRLPFDYAHPRIRLYKGGNIACKLNHTMLDRLKQFSTAEQATLFMTLVAAFKVVFHRFSSHLDISIGTTVSGRDNHNTEGLIGLFVNTLVLRSQLKKESSFREFLQEVKRTTVDALEYQEVPFEKVVEQVVAARDLDQTPLFQVMFSFQNNVLSGDFGLGNLELEPYELKDFGSKFDLTIMVTELENSLNISITYTKDFYSEETIRKLVVHYEHVLNRVIVSPDESIENLSKKALLQERFIGNKLVAH